MTKYFLSTITKQVYKVDYELLYTEGFAETTKEVYEAWCKANGMNP